MAQREALEMAPDDAEAWPDRIYDLLKEHGIRQVALVPDAGHSRLISSIGSMARGSAR